MDLSSNPYQFGALVCAGVAVLIILVNAFCVAIKTGRGTRPENEIEEDDDAPS